MRKQINDFIDTIRKLEYSEHDRYERSGQTYHDGKGDAYGKCAELLTEIVKGSKSPPKIDLSSVNREIIELVGCKFHQIDEVNSGKWPGQYDITKWIDKYQGRQNLPPTVVELNNFRNEVDQFVSLIMSVVHKHLT